jgi:hypothetical protein
MSINEKLEGLAEGMLDSLKTTEVQLPLFGLLWIGLNALLPVYIPASIPLPEALVNGASGVGIPLPAAITPGWLVICMPIIVFAKAMTPGRLPFQTANVKKEETPDA